MGLPGSRPKHKPLPPGPRQYRFTDLRAYLRCSSRRLRRVCADLGIELTTGKRNDRYPATGRLQRKSYKRRLRFLTHSEVTRILVRFRELQGSRITAKAARNSQQEPPSTVANSEPPRNPP